MSMNRIQEEAESAPALQGLVTDLEQRLERMSSALEEMRGVIRSLAAEVGSVDHAEASIFDAVGSGEAGTGAVFTSGIPVPVSAEEESAREAVRRAVGESQTEPEASLDESAAADPSMASEEETGQKSELRYAYGLRDGGDFWARPQEPASAPEPQQPPADDGEEAEREAVRRMVEQTRAEITTDAVTGEAGFDEEAWREDNDSARDDETDEAREAVRLAVEATRAELEAGHPLESGGVDTEPPDKADDPDSRQDQSETVGYLAKDAASELAAGGLSDKAAAEDAPEAAPEDDAEAAREAVRRAVEEARAELDQPRRVEWAEPRSRQTDWPAERGREIESPKPSPIAPLSDEERERRLAKVEALTQPNVIVIEDPAGRVELVQVFNTLNLLDKSGQAALLNYSPHSVTVGLSALSGAPSASDLEAAASAVFGRACRVTSDGSRISVLVGSADAV